MALQEYLSSALTKFDDLEVYFAGGQGPVHVSEMLAKEMLEDGEFSLLLDIAEHVDALNAFVKSFVGRRFGEWKKTNGVRLKTKDVRQEKDVPLPWASIESYAIWVLDKIETYAHTESTFRDAARKHLEDALLGKTVVAASIKYDGTCFGKMDSGELVGRRMVLGELCKEYQRTSTEATARTDAAALRVALSEICGVEVGRLCVWGELMCNPNFYGYTARGLANKWICFGVVVAFPEANDCISAKLVQRGLAHSLNPTGKQVRLMLCPALRQLLTDVARCDVAEAPFEGLSHADVVAGAAGSLMSGENEGLVLAFERGSGQASLRKWKNSAEGANARQREAEQLKRCSVLCAGLATEGALDVRIAEMVETMQRVAEAETSPLKKGRSRVAKAT